MSYNIEIVVGGKFFGEKLTLPLTTLPRMSRLLFTINPRIPAPIILPIFKPAGPRRFILSITYFPIHWGTILVGCSVIGPRMVG